MGGKNERSPRLGWRFWAIFPGLCLSSFLCALDSTVIATALPTIVNQLGSSSSYVWVINGYTLPLTAVQPLYGQAADIFGRKAALTCSLLLFGAGSIVCGAARSTAALIGGRALQGMGGGGLSILPAMVVCDLVPLRERQTYTSIVYVAFAMGTFVGPVIGGALADSAAGWRWIFWLNLPVGGIALVLIVGFLRVNHGRVGTIWDQLIRVDYAGNVLLMASVVALLYALSTGGAEEPWASWKVLLPLLLGLCVGMPMYLYFETTQWCQKPMTPIRLFQNRTSLIAFFLTFLHGIILYWASYFLPVYFQAVLLATPQQSGVNNLPAIIPMVPFGIFGAILIAKTGRYKPNQLAGYALMAIAFGCLSTLDRYSSTAVWAVFQIILAAGGGAVLTALLPAIQAPLPESDVGVTTATWGFIQSLGFVCGIAIPSSIFNSRFSSLLYTVRDEEVRDTLAMGDAYAHGTRAYIITLQGPVRDQVVGLFAAALKLVWQVGLAFALLGFVLALFIGEVKLRENIETDYGYKGDVGTDVETQSYDREATKVTTCPKADRVSVEADAAEAEN